jgi:hypothetical protein
LVIEDYKMKVFQRDQIPSNALPGRRIWNAVSADGFSTSEKVKCGFARYAAEYGALEPHVHGEEVCYVLSAEKGRVRFGSTRENLDQELSLETGMVIHAPAGEWHVFEYGEGGHIEIVFFLLI